MDMAVTAQADQSSVFTGTKQATVLILGGQGALGRVVAEAFRQQGWHVLRAGRRQESAADFRQFDIDNEASLGVGLAGADLIVNTVENRRLAPERYILEHGGLLLNLATVPQAERERVLSAVAAPRGTVIFNVGFVGLMAKVATALLAARPEAESLVLGCTVTAGATSGPEGQGFIQRLLCNRPSHTCAELDFGLPFGRRKALQVDEMGQEGWVSRRVLGDRPLQVHISISERWMMAVVLLLNRMRVLERLPNLTKKPSKKPLRITREPINAHIALHRGDTCLASRTLAARGDYFSTAAITAALAAALSQGTGLKSGLLQYEELDQPLDAVLAQLAPHGISMHELEAEQRR